MFIAMDPPRHDKQRAAVQGVVAPKNLREMEGLIRARVREVLDGLPLNEPFDWVQTVSIELTARMLATLLDFPYDKRHKLVEWSDLATSMEQANGGPSDNDRVFREMVAMAQGLSSLWRDKAARTVAGEEPGFDLITMQVMDVLLSFPSLILGLMVLAIATIGEAIVVGTAPKARLYQVDAKLEGVLLHEFSGDEYARYRAERDAHAREALDGAVPADVRVRCDVHDRVVYGHPAQQILEVAAQERPDLLVMGAYGRGRLRETFGGTTKNLLSKSKFPLLMSH